MGVTTAVRDSPGVELRWRSPELFVLIALSSVPYIAYNWLPVLFNRFEREFDLTLAEQGSTQQLLFTAGLCIALTGGFLTRWLGMRCAPAVAVAIAATALLVCGTSRSFTALQIGCFVYGFGIAWISAIIGVLVSSVFAASRQRMFLLSGMVISVTGGAGPPALAASVAGGYGWRIPFIALACVAAALAVGLILCSHHLPSPATPQAGIGSPAGRHPVRALSFWAIAACYVLHGIGEIGAISWVPKLMHSRSGIDESRMAMLVSAHVLAFALGRLLLTAIAGKFPDRILLAICATGGAVFLSLAVVAQAYAVALIGMGVSGLFMAGNAPAMSAFLGSRFQARLADAYAVYQGLGAVATGLAVWLIGYAGDHLGLNSAVLIIPCAPAVLAGLAVTWEWTVRLSR